MLDKKEDAPAPERRHSGLVVRAGAAFLVSSMLMYAFWPSNESDPKHPKPKKSDRTSETTPATGERPSQEARIVALGIAKESASLVINGLNQQDTDPHILGSATAQSKTLTITNRLPRDSEQEITTLTVSFDGEMGAIQVSASNMMNNSNSSRTESGSQSLDYPAAQAFAEFSVQPDSSIHDLDIEGILSKSTNEADYTTILEEFRGAIQTSTALTYFGADFKNTTQGSNDFDFITFWIRNDLSGGYSQWMSEDTNGTPLKALANNDPSNLFEQGAEINNAAFKELLGP